MITFDKILNEYFYTREDNGVFFDFSNKEDSIDVSQFLKENKAELLNEFNLINILKSGFNFIKSKFKSSVDGLSKIIKSEDVNSVFELIIPHIEIPENKSLDSILEPEKKLNEGAIESIKGNYNEVLTCKYVIEKNKVPILLYINQSILKEDSSKNGSIIVVDLDSDGRGKSLTINDVVNYWDKKLKDESKDRYEEIFSVIKLASKDMSDYIIKKIGKEGGTILAIWLSNQDYKLGAGNKSDIKLKIKKGGPEFFKNFSLKMYNNTKINLINSTLISSIKNWCDEESSQKMYQIIKSNNDLQVLIRLNRIANGCVQRSKKIKDELEFKKIVDEMYKLYKNSGFKIMIPNDKLYTTVGLREVRRDIRSMINPILANYLYDFLKKYISTVDGKNKFIKNFLVSIGFSDKDTDFVLAIIGSKEFKANKARIVDKHPDPDLNFDDMKLEYTVGQTSIRIVNSTKTIATLIFKEGDIVVGFVNFD